MKAYSLDLRQKIVDTYLEEIISQCHLARQFRVALSFIEKLLLITKVGAKLIYLPPYSPEFSPIETCWPKIESGLRSLGAINYSDLVIAVEKVFNKVSLEDIRGWFTDCCYCTSAD